MGFAGVDMKIFNGPSFPDLYVYMAYAIHSQCSVIQIEKFELIEFKLGRHRRLRMWKIQTYYLLTINENPHHLY